MVSKIEEDEEVLVESQQPAKKKLKSSNVKSEYKAPTADELYTLKNTENLYQSNLFRLQLNELVKEITIPSQKLDSFLKITNDLMKNLKNLKKINEIKFTDLKIFEKKSIQIPMSDLCKKMEGSYTFLPPTSSTLVGSSLINTLINSSRVKVDLCIEMPAEYFNERDYLNYRYFIKRNLYMGHVVAQLCDVKKYANVKFELESNISANYKPMLMMNFDESLDVCLHFIPQNKSFKSHRFSPKQSNVRKDWFVKNLNVTKIKSSNDDETNPTPIYNFEILSDLRMQENNLLLKHFITSKNVIESIQMVKLWLIKRGLNTGYGGFDNFILSMYFVYLILNRHINALMSQYQIFRIALLNLAEANWHLKGVNMKDTVKNNSLMNEEELESILKASNNCDLTTEDFHKYYQVVFVDTSGYLNIASKLSKYAFLRVKHEANISIQLLKNEFVDCFDALFIYNHSLDIRFDALIKITNNDTSNDLFYQNMLEKSDSSLAIESSKNMLVDSFNSNYSVALKLIMDTLNKALEQRTNLIFAELVQNTRWSIKLKKSETIPSIIIGLLFNESYDNILIKGPASTSPQAVEFRNFWGPKSELRRFQDTTICEAVLFEQTEASNKRMIYSEIVKHILELHFSIQQPQLNFSNQQLNGVLSLPKGIVNRYGTGEERLADAVNIFEEFSKIIKNLKDLPLMISSVSGLSAIFRHTEVFASLPCCFKYDSNSEKNMYTKLDHKYVPKYPLGPVMVPYVKPLEIACQLESSGKWPDDIECIKRLKSAFYLQIMKMLRDSHGLIVNTTVDYCDCVYKGLVFRLILFTMSELLCIKKEVNEHGVILTNETKQSLAYEKNMFHIPKLNSVLHALQQKYNCFSGVCRLAKRWLSSHFLIEYFEEEAIDLLCAYLFVHTISYEPPRSIMVGFLRFLDLVSNFDWKNQFLLVNFNNDLSKEQILNIQVIFQEKRTTLPSVYIVTPYDSLNKNSMWTCEKPNIQQLCRTVILARQTVAKLKYSINNFDSNENFKNLFRPSSDIFDIKINLKPSYCVKAFQKIDVCEGTFLPHYRDYVADTTNKDKNFPVVDLDPVKLYVDELRKTFGDMALFFYDVYGATQIFVLWKPDTLSSKELKIQNAKYRFIDTDKNSLVLNVEAIIDDFKIIGNELVESISIKNDSSIFK